MKNFLTIIALTILLISCRIEQIPSRPKVRDNRVTYTFTRNPKPLDNRIVLVNAGQLSRSELSTLLDSINNYSPRVVGIDVVFQAPSDNPHADSLLEISLSRIKNLVFARSEFSITKSRYSRYGTVGHTLLNLDANTQICESFNPIKHFSDKEYHSFAIEVVNAFNPELTRNLDQANEMSIDYSGNILDYGATTFGTRFLALNKWDIDNGNFDPSTFNDKIVILTYLGDEFGDKAFYKGPSFISPFNETFRQAHPDMWLGVIHANIVSMLLDQK